MSIIQSKSQLIDYFNKGVKKYDQLLIGVEHEKFLFTGKEKKRANHEQIKKIFYNGRNIHLKKMNYILIKK